MFTPPSLVTDGPNGKKGTIVVPGTWGAGNWNTPSFDPETGIFYAASITIPYINDLEKPRIRKRRCLTRSSRRGRHHRRSRQAKRGGSGRVRSDFSGPGGAQRQDAAIARADARVGAADHEAALRPHHGARSQSRDAAVDGAQRRWPAEPSAAEGSESPAARNRRPRRAAHHEDAAVHRRRQRRDPRRSRWCLRQEIPRLRQGHRQGRLGDGAAGGHHRRPDDLLAQGKQYIVVPIGGKGSPAEWVALGLP